MGDEPKRVVAQSVRLATESKKSTKREVWATLCFYYPQYTLEQASKLPMRDVNLLIKVARKIEAGKMMDFLNIIVSPHSKKPDREVKKLFEHFEKLTK